MEIVSVVKFISRTNNYLMHWGNQIGGYVFNFKERKLGWYKRVFNFLVDEPTYTWISENDRGWNRKQVVSTWGSFLDIYMHMVGGPWGHDGYGSLIHGNCGQLT